MSITDSEIVSIAFGIQHAMRMRRIMLSSMACPALQYFTTLSHKRHGFRNKKVTEHITCVLNFTAFVRKISHSEKISERYYHKCTFAFM